jgi:hypothetical protein
MQEKRRRGLLFGEEGDERAASGAARRVFLFGWVVRRGREGRRLMNEAGRPRAVPFALEKENDELGVGVAGCVGPRGR